MFFRQRCVQPAHICNHAHGLSDLNRVPFDNLIEMQKDIFNLERLIGVHKHEVVYNPKSGKYEVFKVKEIRELKAGENNLKASLKTLDLDKYPPLDNLEDARQLLKFDIAKCLEVLAEVNKIKRVSRNAKERDILKPWQDTLMSNFLKLLIKEATDENTYLEK